MTIKPLGDKIVLKKAETEETTASGFILTTASKEKPQMSEVVAVGPGGVVEGYEVVMTVKPGDKVIVRVDRSGDIIDIEVVMGYQS